MISFRCLSPNGCRILSLGIDLAEGECGQLPQTGKWRKMAKFLSHQGKIKILSGAKEETKAKKKVVKKTAKKTAKKTVTKAKKKDADAV